jgi:hypothetical protein
MPGGWEQAFLLGETQEHRPWLRSSRAGAGSALPAEAIDSG